MHPELETEALRRLRHSVVAVRPRAEPARVHGQRIHRRGAVHDPVGEETTGAAALHHPHAGTRQQPRVVEPEGRTDEGVRVRRERDRPVHDGPDPGARERRHPLHGQRDDGLDPVQVRRQQLHAEVAGYAVDAPRAAVRLVGSHDEAVAFLAQVPALLRVADHRQLRLPRCHPRGDFRHPGGHQVLVQHRHHRQVHAHHGADFPAPGARRIDDVLGPDRIAAGVDDPWTRGVALDRLHRLAAPDLRASGTGAGGKRVRGERRIDVPVVGLVNCTEHPVDARQRVDAGQLLGSENVKPVAEERPEPLHVPELGHTLDRAGDAKCSARMEAGRFAGLGGKDVAVQAHRSRTHLHDGRVVREVGAEAGRVPGRAGGELALLDEHDVAPAARGEVVGEGDTHDAPADDHDPRIGFHRFVLPAAVSTRLPCPSGRAAGVGYGSDLAPRTVRRGQRPRCGEFTEKAASPDSRA